VGIIRELPPSVINQIAAGEVVERPSSVVKELLENAIDAGATRVEVSVERGGKDLIRVADDGQGMDPDDLLLAFRPHATSKLASADDLFHVRTLGFRGEALAAIAEIAKVRCQSRTAGASKGSEITIEGGVASPVRDCAGPPGTVIEVRNLFYNTPVRRTFLRADTTEAGHVAEAVIRVALAHPTVQITYRTGGKVVYDLPATTGVKERVAAFFGQELADALIWVESRAESTHLWGYVAHPSQSRSSSKSQYLFVGGRFVRDRSLGHALSEAYRGLLMVGRLPIAFLYLDVPPEEVDVNVHPTKIEVRFRDSNRVYSQLLATIRQTFLSSDLHSRLQVTPSTAAQSPAPNAPASTGPFALRSPSTDRQAIADWFTPSRPTTTPTGGRQAPASPSELPSLQRPPVDWSQRAPRIEPAALGSAFDEIAAQPPGTEATTSQAADLPAPVATTSSNRTAEHPPKAIQIHDSYLVAETEDGLLVVDQHALHERILYEEFKARLERGGVEAQRLLVPEPVELSPADAAEVLQRRDALARLGLELEPFGGDTVLVGSSPAMLAHVPPERLLRDLAEQFRSSELAPTPDAVLDEVLSLVACKAAVKAGQRLSAEEIDALLERRHLVDSTHHCPHGRPTALTLTKAELERQFGRI
jgi:DNA mismatch repair protein MutL